MIDYEIKRAELVARIDKLTSQLAGLDHEQHIAQARQALADAAARGADDGELSALGDALRRASDGSDVEGQARTIAQARIGAAKAELAELEAAEQARQRELLAAEVLEAGERLKVAAEEAAQAFKAAVLAHMKAGALMARRERCKAILAGRPFDGIAMPDLYRFEPLNNLYGQVLPASAFALGRDDSEFRQIAAEAEREANQLRIPPQYHHPFRFKPSQ